MEARRTVHISTALPVFHHVDLLSNVLRREETVDVAAVGFGTPERETLWTVENARAFALPPAPPSRRRPRRQHIRVYSLEHLGDRRLRTARARWCYPVVKCARTLPL